MALKDSEDLGWNQICEDENCFMLPLAHTHDFELGKKISKVCCNMPMESAQIYENEFGKNNSMLRISYWCLKCGKKDGVALYEGLPKNFKDIYLEAKAFIESIE
ncbi:TPA: hypothetical protein JA331_00005 [Legionella pneumophila]|nr:hypothetical protein [Legionella pneumophila]HAT8845566.1 hypothetical protein [Legionella pneumophila subsp. pneumophila]HCC3259282.1 hypothetical protein [Legionella pneumophila subsp. pneumophila]